MLSKVTPAQSRMCDSSSQRLETEEDLETLDADRARGAAPSSAHALAPRGAAGASVCFAGTADAGFLSLRVAGGATNEKSATMVNVSYETTKKGGGGGRLKEARCAA